MAITASVTHAQFELHRRKVTFAAAIEPFVSRDWILRNVFNLTDEEISRRNPLDSFIRQVFEGA